jgi:hypothetical protein
VKVAPYTVGPLTKLPPAWAASTVMNFFTGLSLSKGQTDLFSQHQLCWAHLIRQAIKLALQHPDEPQYAEFLDGLCSIYDDAKQLRQEALAAEDARVQIFQPTEDAPRVALMKLTVKQLQDRITSLCSRREETIITVKAAAKADPTIEPTADHVATFILLQRELTDNVDCLFVFVEHPEVEPTNNRSERNVRREAEIRKGARTSKTARGAKRSGTIVTVLASLKTQISNFTLTNVLAEIDRWWEAGSSLFQRERQAIHLTLPPPASTS